MSGELVIFICCKGGYEKNENKKRQFSIKRYKDY